ncbi:MAG: type IV toxin-antitoxin system AbiEi family antitoxin domain-containing protein [Propionibacteriales bacterium]|nr:type IV toxin-antitoxin system AbiEi family antitoxin domain-containing protein [Propionibacteriales bacterium]
MNEVELAARERGGFVLRSDLLALGWSDQSIAAHVMAGLLTRIRVGTYALPQVLTSLDREQRHLLLARSVLAKFAPGSMALSHHSAAIAHGLATWAVDLRVVHVMRLDPGSARSESGVHHHRRLDGLEIVETPSGLPAVRADHAAFQVACGQDVRRALVVMDSALHLGLAERAALQEATGRFRGWHGSRLARLVVRRADPGAQTAAESLLRQACFEAGLPIPVTQYPVADDRGEVFAWTDLGWPEHRHVGEVDGRRKYWRDLRPGEDASDVVVREKHREDRIRRRNFGVSRATFAEVTPKQARATGRRIAHELEQSDRIYRRGRRYLA